jgi:hypothetical protein
VATSPCRGIYGGIGTSFKITPEASTPVNKGPPAFGAERSVKPSAQPTLVRTQHPPPENSQLLLKNSRALRMTRTANRTVYRTAASAHRRCGRSPFATQISSAPTDSSILFSNFSWLWEQRHGPHALKTLRALSTQGSSYRALRFASAQRWTGRTGRSTADLVIAAEAVYLHDAGTSVDHREFSFGFLACGGSAANS